MASNACGPDPQRVNGNAPSHLTRQTTCVSHRKPAIDQITPPVCKHTHSQICSVERKAPRWGSERPIWRRPGASWDAKVRHQIRARALTNCIPIQGNGARSPFSFLPEVLWCLSRSRNMNGGAMECGRVTCAAPTPISMHSNIGLVLPL